MIQPLISVIVPLYNKEQWVKRAIESILAQTYVHMEILIVNDGSTDNGLELVTAIHDPRIKISSKTNGGVSSARNLGLDNTKGEYIAFLDADDEWEPRHLEVLIKGFERFENAIVICDDLVELRDNKCKNNAQRRNLSFDIKKKNEQKVQYYPIEEYLQTLSDDYFILSGSSVLIKASVIRELQLRFYENMTHGEDVNYWIQLSQYGKFVFCDYLGVVYHHVDEQSAMNKKITSAQLTPDYFYGLAWEDFRYNEQKNILKFLRREYYKKAYQNRGLSLRSQEFSGMVGKINLGFSPIIIYTIVRFSPKAVLTMLKKLKGKL